MNDTPTLSQLLAVARGDEPADLVLAGGRVVDVFTGEVYPGDVAVCGNKIAAVGPSLTGHDLIDLQGAFVAPGLIDAHVHIESSLCTPPQFAAAVAVRGVTSVVTDPHEIANVVGPAGVRYMAEASKGLPLHVVVMGPSCVPATHMATAGGTVTADDLATLHRDGTIHGLAEAMNFPGVIGGDPLMLAKLAALVGRPVDGHAPGISGRLLDAYAAAGVGSDHECVSVEEASEKLRRGLYLLIREATNAKNLDALLPVVTPGNSRRICFCTDDRTPGELLREGSVDTMVRRAIAFGIGPVEAIRMATLNTAEWFGLRDRGAVAPGRAADLFVFDDLQAPHAKLVVSGGRVVARDGRMSINVPTPTAAAPSGRCVVDFDPLDLSIPARGERVRVIGHLADQLVTEHRVLPAKIEAGRAVADVSRDLLKMVVIERHNATGNVGRGFIQGVGLRRGAVAGTVAHDHHNLVSVGTGDAAMLAACRAVAEMNGGLAVHDGDQIIAKLPLPVGGLMSDRPVAEVAAAYDECVAAARGLGSPLADPLMAMSFMALEVIPSLKLTDLGLVDIERFEIVDLFAEEPRANVDRF